MNTLWEDMTVEEKLDWLHERVRDTADRDQVNRVFGTFDRKIQKIADDLEELKKHTQSAE
jgi:hypothetical protein